MITAIERPASILFGLFLIAVSVIGIMLLITAMPGEACMEWDGWHYEKIWPLPESCQTPGEES